jgi:hypothetical protein
MSAFTINIPIRTQDANDVRNAFASSYGYSEFVSVGGVQVPNPISIEEFIKQKCINFMLETTKKHLITIEEIAAREAAQQAASTRAQEVTIWFDDRRLDSIGGEAVYQRFPSIDNQSISTNKNASVDFSPTGTDPDNLPLTFFVTTPALSGTVLGSGQNFTYLPNNRFIGSDSFKMKSNNGTKNSLEGTISVTISRTLTTVDRTYNLRKNNNLNTFLEAEDAIGEVIFSIVDNPTHGIISGINPITYIPELNFMGSDSFTFTCQDDELQGDVGTITINIVLLTASNLFYTTQMNNAINFQLGAEHTIGNYSYNITQQPVNGTLYIDNEFYTYIPNTDFVGADSITYTVTDTLETSEPGTISFNVTN